MGKIEGNVRAVHDLNDSERVQEQVLAPAPRIPFMFMALPSHSRTMSIFTHLCISKYGNLDVLLCVRMWSNRAQYDKV